MVDRYLLFPGRHHLLTQFQADYLRRYASDGMSTVVWAVTSANHQNTRRNPIPFHRREAAIERFSVLENLPSLVVPVFDTAPTDRFAEVTLKNVTAALGLSLDPDNCLVACSTPEVAALYRRLGFPIAGVEADEGSCPARPWDVLLSLANEAGADAAETREEDIAAMDLDDLVNAAFLDDDDD